MRIAFGVILVTGICGGFFGARVSALPAALRVASRELNSAIGKMFQTYNSISNDRVDDSDKSNVISRFQQLYFDNPKYNENENNRQGKRKPTAYFLAKEVPQRNRRYISYLTLCHFKICNMGRKRTTRYFAR